MMQFYDKSVLVWHNNDGNFTKISIQIKGCLGVVVGVFVKLLIICKIEYSYFLRRKRQNILQRFAVDQSNTGTQSGVEPINFVHGILQFAAIPLTLTHCAAAHNGNRSPCETFHIVYQSLRFGKSVHNVYNPPIMEKFYLLRWRLFLVNTFLFFCLLKCS